MAKNINILPAVQVSGPAVTVDVQITEGGATRTTTYAFSANDFDCNYASTNPYVAKFMFEPGDITMILDVQGDFTTLQFNSIAVASAYALAQSVVADIGQYASGGAGYTFPTNHGNTAYVSVDGNDLTGVVGNISKPFETANAAIAALSALVDGAIVILSSSGAQFITDYDYSTMPYIFTINDLCSCGITFNNSCSFGDLRVNTGGDVLIDTNFLFSIDNSAIINCDDFIVLQTVQGDVTVLGNINCNTFTTNANTNNPSLTFGSIDWKNSLNVFEPITYNRCNPMVWKGIINQADTNAPTATVFENTLGETPTFSYQATADYHMTSPGNKFTTKTHITYPNNSAAMTPLSGVSLNRQSTSVIQISSYDSFGSQADSQIIDVCVTIEIYP